MARLSHLKCTTIEEGLEQYLKNLQASRLPGAALKLRRMKRLGIANGARLEAYRKQFEMTAAWGFGARPEPVAVPQSDSKIQKIVEAVLAALGEDKVVAVASDEPGFVVGAKFDYENKFGDVTTHTVKNVEDGKVFTNRDQSFTTTLLASYVKKGKVTLL